MISEIEIPRLNLLRDGLFHTLNKYDYLVQKLYTDTATNMLMIIINTYVDKDSRLFMAAAHPFDFEIQTDNDNLLSVHIPIHGDSGVYV